MKKGNAELAELLYLIHDINTDERSLGWKISYIKSNSMNVGHTLDRFCSDFGPILTDFRPIHGHFWKYQ